MSMQQDASRGITQAVQNAAENNSRGALLQAEYGWAKVAPCAPVACAKVENKTPDCARYQFDSVGQDIVSCLKVVVHPSTRSVRPKSILAQFKHDRNQFQKSAQSEYVLGDFAVYTFPIEVPLGEHPRLKVKLTPAPPDGSDVLVSTCCYCEAQEQKKGLFGKKKAVCRDLSWAIIGTLGEYNNVCETNSNGRIGEGERSAIVDELPERSTEKELMALTGSIIDKQRKPSFKVPRIGGLFGKKRQDDGDSEDEDGGSTDAAGAASGVGEDQAKKSRKERKADAARRKAEESIRKANEELEKLEKKSADCRADAEAKRAEADAKKADAEVKKAEAKRDAEAKKADAEVKKAEARRDAKKKTEAKKAGTKPDVLEDALLDEGLLADAMEKAELKLGRDNALVLKISAMNYLHMREEQLSGFSATLSSRDPASGRKTSHVVRVNNPGQMASLYSDGGYVLPVVVQALADLEVTVDLSPPRRHKISLVPFRGL